MSKYKVEMKVSASEKDLFYIPTGRGVNNLLVTGSFAKQSNNHLQVDEIVKDERGNKYLKQAMEKGEFIKISREVLSLPPRPELSPEKCLNNGEWYCKWKEGGTVIQLVSSSDSLREREKVLLFGDRLKELGYSFPRTKYEWTDEVLEKKLSQDCLGIHGVLCSMLRASGVPAIVDIGLRLDIQDKPHVWLWFFEKSSNEWIIVDLKDSDRKILVGFSRISPRISMTLGTKQSIGGGTASFVQYMVSKKMVEGNLKNSHRVDVEVMEV